MSFPGAWPGARGAIAETAFKWARLFAASAQACNAYTVCEQVKCPGCRPSKKSWRWAAEHLTATVQRIAISGDRAAATFSNHGQELETVQLRRTATGEWLIDRLGQIGAVGSSN